MSDKKEFKFYIVGRNGVHIVSNLNDVNDILQEEMQMKSTKEISNSFDERDIELVMNQANTTKETAEKALVENNGDVVNAILSIIEEKRDS